MPTTLFPWLSMRGCGHPTITGKPWYQRSTAEEIPIRSERSLVHWRERRPRWRRSRQIGKTESWNGQERPIHWSKWLSVWPIRGPEGRGTVPCDTSGPDWLCETSFSSLRSWRMILDGYSGESRTKRSHLWFVARKSDIAPGLRNNLNSKAAALECDPAKPVFPESGSSPWSSAEGDLSRLTCRQGQVPHLALAQGQISQPEL